MRRNSKFLLKGINLVIDVLWARWGKFSKFYLIICLQSEILAMFVILKSIISPVQFLQKINFWSLAGVGIKMPGCTWWRGNLETEELVLTASYTIFEQMLGFQPYLSPLSFALKFNFLGTMEKQRNWGDHDIQSGCWVLYLNFFYFQVSGLELNNFNI